MTYNHNKDNILEALNISYEDVQAITHLVTKNLHKKTPSEIAEVIEHAIKEDPILLRALIAHYLCYFFIYVALDNMLEGKEETIEEEEVTEAKE